MMLLLIQITLRPFLITGVGARRVAGYSYCTQSGGLLIQNSRTIFVTGAGPGDYDHITTLIIA